MRQVVFSLLRNDCKKDKVLVAVIDETVGMPFWAVMAQSRANPFVFSVIKHFTGAMDKINDFTACVMGMQANRRTWLQCSIKDFIGVITVSYTHLDVYKRQPMPCV